jgi:hypothetical protein
MFASRRIGGPSHQAGSEAPTKLEGRYGKIGISAVEAAARYSSAGKRTGTIKRKANQQREREKK